MKHSKDERAGSGHSAVQCWQMSGGELSRFMVPQAAPACPSDRSNVQMKMSAGHWWNDTDRWKPRYCAGLGSNGGLRG